MKGDIGIKLDKLEEIYLNLNKDELPNYYNDFFKLKLISKDEPILLTGPSSYKTYIAKDYIKSNKANFKKIYLNQKTTIEELLGGPRFLSQNSAKEFYLDKLTEILKLDNPGKSSMEEINQKIRNKIELFRTEQDIYIILENLFNNFEKLGKLENNEKSKP